MAKQTIVTQSSQDRALMQFMLEQLGGEEAVMMEFYRKIIVEFADENKTFGELVEHATKNGWVDHLNNMKLTAIATIINPPPVHDTEGQGGTSRRLTKAEIMELRDSILEYLGENAWASKSDIAEAVSFPKAKLGPQIQALRREDKIKKHGEKGGTRYALKSEKTKPKS